MAAINPTQAVNPAATAPAMIAVSSIGSSVGAVVVVADDVAAVPPTTEPAAAVAAQVGIDDVIANVLPADKADKVAELIGLPEDHAVGMMIAVGKATKPAWPKPGQLPYEDVVIRNRFN